MLLQSCHTAHLIPQVRASTQNLKTTGSESLPLERKRWFLGQLLKNHELMFLQGGLASKLYSSQNWNMLIHDETRLSSSSALANVSGELYSFLEKKIGLRHLTGKQTLLRTRTRRTGAEVDDLSMATTPLRSREERNCQRFAELCPSPPPTSAPPACHPSTTNIAYAWVRFEHAKWRGSMFSRQRQIGWFTSNHACL